MLEFKTEVGRYMVTFKRFAPLRKPPDPSNPNLIVIAWVAEQNQELWEVEGFAGFVQLYVYLRCEYTRGEDIHLTVCGLAPGAGLARFCSAGPGRKELNDMTNELVYMYS